MVGKLYVVATPIGNLEDLSERAKRILEQVDLVAAEDTRVTRKLFARFKVNTPLTSFHQHTSASKLQALIERLKAGENLALVCDAGTPGIADPGGKLVSEAAREGIEVVAVPGPTALVACLSLAGFPAQSFVFVGFLPKKKGRQKTLQAAAQLKKTFGPLVFYESAQRLSKTLNQLSAIFGEDTPAVVCRELTKLFEETSRGTLGELSAAFAPRALKGEVTLCLFPK